MWREIARVLGLALGGLTLIAAFFAAMFRFDSSDEYREVLWLDVEIGFAAAVSVILVGIPPVGRNTFRWRVALLLIALFVGALMWGGLTWHHYWQDLVRSGSY